MQNFVKRTAAGVLALGLSLSAAAVPAWAAGTNQDGEGTLSTAFTFTYRNDPTYTVIIPDAVTITEEGAQVSISAEDVAWLDGQKVSVTIAGTDAYRFWRGRLPTGKMPPCGTSLSWKTAPSLKPPAARTRSTG